MTRLGKDNEDFALQTPAVICLFNKSLKCSIELWNFISKLTFYSIA